MKLQKSYPYYLANEAVFANEDLVVTDKSTNQEATRVALADKAAVDAAIEACSKATRSMANLESWQKKQILLQVAKEVRERKEEVSYALCIEAGKPITYARGEVDRAIETLEIAAEESVRMYGEYTPLDISQRTSGYSSITRRFPIGPVSMISPFNFPINLAVHKIAPAIAVGVPFVLKPASRTPIGALILGDILSRTSLPKGAFSILPCSRESGDSLTTDDRFKLISFTGSDPVGWDIKKRAGKKKVVLELGGNAAVLVDEGVEQEEVVKRLVFGTFYQSGQSCISVQRIYVHEALYESFVPKFVQAVKDLKVGNPLDEDTFVGPLITEGDAKRLDEWVQEAVGRGAKVLVGGGRKGSFYDATVVENVPADTHLSSNEAFGPVCTIESFTDFKGVIEKMNDSRYGLQAGVFTNNFNKAFYAFQELEVGGVVINDVPSVRIDSQAYGGVKDSGLGREGVRYAMEDMTELKVMVLHNAGKL